LGVLRDPLTHRAVFESFDEGRGARTLTSALLSFRNVYVPAAANPDEEYAGISVVLNSDADVEEAARRMRAIWKPAGEDPLMSLQSVGVFVRKEWMDALGATTQTGAFLGNIIWIIIVGVAVVMISTLNLLTIRERYDELAIRRCEGARRRDVALQVTVEGTLLALVGGVAGLPLGYLAAAVLRDIVDFPFRFEARYAIAATGVAILLGLFASVVPARRAAALQPARVLTRRLT
ncbi:MAG: ABC transporter permease, partial [Planctomycetota bacterium]